MKKGISLIVLVITIIVIIILAGAVILSLAQNNPIGQANEATRASDAGEIESALSMYLGTIMGKYRDQVKLSSTVFTNPATIENADLATATVNVVNSSGTQLYLESDGDVTTTSTNNTAITITPAALGLTSWPTYAGYKLMVDENANVSYVAG